MPDDPDYKEMYLTLFHEITKAVSALQRAQQQTEEQYVCTTALEDLFEMKSGIILGGEENNEQPSQG